MRYCVEKKDETPFSTMKFGSDTLDEEQEKAEFFNVSNAFFHSNRNKDSFASSRISNKIMVNIGSITAY